MKRERVSFATNCGIVTATVTDADPTKHPEPGDIIVYRERGASPSKDRFMRGTYRRRCERYGNTIVARGEEEFYVEPNDVVRIEPSQWGWAGAPASSGAW